MDKNYLAAIEFGCFTSQAIILSYHNNRFDVLASYETKTLGFDNGIITDKEAFYKSINDLKEGIYDLYKIPLDEAILVLPNNTHKVYNGSVRNNILTARQIISNNEIAATRAKLVNSFKNEGEILIDESPVSYILDNNRVFRNSPSGQQSSVLNIKSNLHSTSLQFLNQYLEAFKDNNIKYLGSVFNSTCAAYLPFGDYLINGEVIHVNILQDCITISVFANNVMYDSLKIDYGLSTLVSALIDNLGVEKDEALDLINSYFVADLNLANDIFFDEERELSEKRISQILLGVINNINIEISKAINSFVKLANFTNPNILLSGLFNDFDGFIEYFSQNMNYPVKSIDVNIIGIHGNLYLNCYGAIYNFVYFNEDKINKRLNSFDHLDIPSVAENEIVSTIKQTNDKENETKKFIDIFNE